MIQFTARTEDITKFVNEVADYETYLITGEYPGNRPANQILYKKIYLSVRSTDSENLGESFALDISQQNVEWCRAIYYNNIDNPTCYGKVKSFRAYDKREKKNDERLENCKVIDWGYVGIIIMCEEESIVILSPKKKTKYTTIDGKYHEITKCCDCPYKDTGYAMCIYPNSNKDIPITVWEKIMKDCPLRDKE